MLAADVRDLPPEHPDPADEEVMTLYRVTRRMMIESISLAMKYEMRADVYTRRSLKPDEFDVTINRTQAASSWWGFREAIRKAMFYHSCARIFLEEVTEASQKARRVIQNKFDKVYAATKKKLP